MSALPQDLRHVDRKQCGRPGYLTEFPARPWQGLLVIYLAIVFLTLGTWEATAEILVDFGRELYVPWQLADGKVLYRDIGYFNGPLSPLFNAAAFRIFGTSITTLLLTNAIIWCVIVTTLFTQLIRYFSVSTATLCCLAITILCGVAHLSGHGNYNFISPYSHEMTHGTLLAVLIFALLGYDELFSWKRWIPIGCLWGLVFLGKAEIFVAVSGMIGCAVLFPLLSKRSTVRDAALRTSACLAGGALVVAIFWGYLARQTGLTEAALNLLGTWRHILGSNVTQLDFYLLVTGLNDPAKNIEGTFNACLAIAVVLLGLYALERGVGGRGWFNPLAAACVFLAWWIGGRSLLVLQPQGFMVLAVVLLVAIVWQAQADPETFTRNQHLACWSVFAVLMLSKMLLRPRLHFYGFALSLPIVALLIPMGMEWLPKRLFRSRRGHRFRLALAGLIVIDLVYGVNQTFHNIRDKTVQIETHVGSLRCEYEKGIQLKPVLEILSATKPDQTLLVLPEGVTINFLAQRSNPSPFINFMPPELEMYGEDEMVKQFEDHPADYVLLISRNVTEYGKTCFGESGYGDRIMNWVERNYELQREFGAAPDDPDEFGIQVLRRRNQ